MKQHVQKCMQVSQWIHHIVWTLDYALPHSRAVVSVSLWYQITSCSTHA